MAAMLASQVTAYCCCYYFLPDFLMPPTPRGPPFAAFALASSMAFCCAFCLAWKQNKVLLTIVHLQKALTHLESGIVFVHIFRVLLGLLQWLLLASFASGHFLVR